MTTTIHPSYAPFNEREMPRLSESVWRGLNAFALHSLFHTMNLFDVMRARDTERFEEVEVAADVAYSDAWTRWRALDIWRPRDRSVGPLPALIFIHGGGFRTASKRTHWFFARAFARMGFVVFSVDYRLGPQHPYPAALEDVCEAFCWIARHASEHGADLERLVIAGESAGGNLATALAIAALTRRPEPFATRVFDTGLPPVALLPMCGMLQVRDIERYARARASRLALPALRDAARSYVGEQAYGPAPEDPDLADPLLVLEHTKALDRGAPACFAPVGERDPLLGDTLRLEEALRAHGARARARRYAGGGHSFMAFMWNERAQRCWADIHTFLNTHVPSGPGARDQSSQLPSGVPSKRFFNPSQHAS